MKDRIQLKALAKINLGLDVLRRREDGYHEVKMIMQTISLHDDLEIRRIKTPEIQVKTNLYYLPTNENNLVYKAAKLLMDEFGIKEGVAIQLKKRIPVAAGMAGGSTDGAAVLWGMNQMYGLGLSRQELMERGVKLGADVPYCVQRGTALAEGIGERLSVLPSMPKCTILIAKPGISVSTKFVYENLKLGAYTRKDKNEIAESLAKVYKSFPRLEERKNQLAGTLSGGEQQMLAMGRALMSKPKIILMDEPSMGLSPIFVEEIFHIIREISASGTTVLLVEQNAKKALAIANRAYVLETGNIVLSGDAKEMMNNDSIKKAYLGE